MPRRKSQNLKTVFLLLIVSAFSLSACRSPQKTDLRKFVPVETLVYLETNDVADTLKTLTASPAFQSLAANELDFSALKNIQTAVSVTGFETIEENSVLNLKPQFVVVIETHAWHWQAVSLTENQIDKFVRKTFDETAKLEKNDKNDGVFYIWTANDNRQVFAFVRQSLIYFGNDSAALEKCAAVRNGEAESLARNESFSRAYTENNLAFGYISTNGIRKISDLAGVSVAVNAAETDDGKSFIAKVLPQVLQNTTEEIVWTANRSAGGIKDVFAVRLKPAMNSDLKEILHSDTDSNINFIEFLPPDVLSATRYHLKNPLIAWRGLLLTTAQNTDALSGNILLKFSDNLLELYGISDAKTFLSAIDSPVMTVQFDAENDKSVSIAAIKDFENLKTSISKEFNFKSPSEKQFGSEIWFSSDKILAAAFIENTIVLGDSESVLNCLRVKESSDSEVKNPAFARFAESRNLAATFGKDVDSAAKVVNILGNLKNENRKPATFFTTETRLTEYGFERVTVSDFGLIGVILGKFN